jgi:hypothetical protein
MSAVVMCHQFAIKMRHVQILKDRIPVSVKMDILEMGKEIAQVYLNINKSTKVFIQPQLFKKHFHFK